MCGIAGFSGGYSPDLLGAMSALLAHRGPDGAGTWFDPQEGVGLAHRRLSIIDLSQAASQPMWDVERRVAVSYNGELYNFRELRRELEASGFVFRTQSDTEVLLNLYKRDGAKMLGLLKGIFAFAIWDSESREIFLARDQLGVKPLYWARTRLGILFASEIKALLADDGLDSTIDSQALEHYFTYLWCPAPRTPLMSVKKLEPGCAMTIRAGRIEKSWRYYRLPYDQQISDRSPNDLANEIRNAVRQAVGRQMVADVPVGAFLSGGLDSSAVVAFATGVRSDGPLNCFTIALDPEQMRYEGQLDDLPYAQAVAERLSVPLHVVRPGSHMIGQLDKMVYHLDEPQADPAPLNVLFISELAQQHGMKVLLSGTGGDDIFTGYRRHAALHLERYWSWLPSSMRSGLRMATGKIAGKSPVARRIRKSFSNADKSQDQRIAGYFHWLTPDMSARLVGRSVQSECDPLISALGDLPAGTHPINKMLYLDCRFFLADHNLNYTDKLGMAAGVEIRVPLLDLDLVALAARLPIHVKQRNMTGKWIFRKAMRGILPDVAIDRAKSGFGMPLRHWLRNDLRSVLEETITMRSRLSGHVNIAMLQSLVQMDRQGVLDASYPLFGALALDSWLRQFSDGSGVREAAQSGSASYVGAVAE